MRLRPNNTELARELRKLVLPALQLATKRLCEALPILTGGVYNTLDDFFGDNTCDKTKFSAPIFNPALQSVANSLNVEYITEEVVGYDAKLLGCELENKLSLTKSTSSFATGNNHSKAKTDKHFVVKVTQEGNNFPEVFAAIVDLSIATHPDTGWTDSVTKTGKNNNGFSQLQIHKSDALCVEVIYGRIRPTRKYMHTEYESVNQSSSSS